MVEHRVRRGPEPECKRFSPVWADRLWGPHEPGDAARAKVYRQMAALVCQDCRFTPICLATSICNADQHGIVAGLPVRARRRVRRMAEAAGIEIVRGEQASVQRLSRWIYANPEVIATARAEENKRLRRELNTSNQRRLRDNKRTGDAVPVVSSPPESDGSGNQGRLFE